MKENKLDYTPEPMDLSSVDLPESLIQLSERIAENVHEVWAKAGWTKAGLMAENAMISIKAPLSGAL